VYLYYKDKNEILFELHEIGFRRFGAYNQELPLVADPLQRLHKLGENYLRFGLENPEFYNLMFILPAPMEVIECQKECSWTGGEEALGFLRSVILESIEQSRIAPGDVNTISMAIWGMVHGLVSLAIRQRFSKLVPAEEVVPTMHKALDWLIHTLRTQPRTGS
jgi:AcrR family transcriptional regulator